MIAVCIPTRGLIHSRTVEDILNNLRDYDYKFFFAHGLKIPDAHNKCLTDALADPEIAHIWFVEEDMQLPKGILDELIATNALFAAADYPVQDTESCIQRIGNEGILRVGHGCTLYKRELFDIIEPMFQTKYSYTLPDLISSELTYPDNQWGGQDLDFCIRLKREHGIEATVIDTTAGQYRVVKYGHHDNNKGYHEVEVWRLDEPIKE